MKILKSVLVLFFTLSVQLLLSAPPKNIVVKIAKYKNDKTCAISYTFDDGLAEHYSLVAPYFNKLNFKGTFFINGSKINDKELLDTTRMSWQQLKEMSLQGHEISNHGWAHRNFGRFSFEEIKEDVLKNDSAIVKYIGKNALTFCYPNNVKTVEGVKFVNQNRVGTRTFQHSIGSKWTLQQLDSWVADLIVNKEWGVGMTHGITYGYDAFKNPDIFWQHLNHVKAQEAIIWVATFEEIAAYTKAQENTKISITKLKNKWLINTSCNLDKTLFTVPLTLVLEQTNHKKIIAKQAGKKLLLTKKADKLLFDIDPFAGNIVLLFK